MAYTIVTKTIRDGLGTSFDMLFLDNGSGKVQPLHTLSGSNLRDAEAVTPNDAADLPKVVAATHVAACALFVGTGGNVTVTVNGADITFTGLAGGMWHPLPPFTRVKATGTTAGNLVAGY